MPTEKSPAGSMTLPRLLIVVLMLAPLPARARIGL